VPGDAAGSVTTGIAEGRGTCSVGTLGDGSGIGSRRIAAVRMGSE
jgi:hypothetical protein